MDRRILIIGGTGVFGKKLARHLATFDGIELFVSSRTASKAERVVAELRVKIPKLKAQGIALDHRKTLLPQLEAIKPFAAIDCSGPFQSSNYDAARTIIKAGVHFIDLADARDYLAHFSTQLDELAQSNGVAALAGASSTPTLSSCAVDDLTAGWQRIDTIDICISPGGKSEVGRSVIEAILSYAGKKIPLWQNGHLTQTIGWSGARVVDFPKLGLRRVAAVETFDAEYLGPLHNVRSRVSFSAGLESVIEQYGIEAIATLQKYRLFPSPNALIPLLLKARQITRLFTSDQGGMLVEIRGVGPAGRFTQAKWSLIAKNDHGPFIPVLPTAAVLKKLLANEISAGAYLAHKHITLSDVLAQMAPYDIATQIDLSHITQSGSEVYLGNELFQKLPLAVQAFHAQSAPPIWHGFADIQSGQSIFTKVLARLFGFPKASDDVPVMMCVDRTVSDMGEPTERWTRTFGNKSMSSVLRRHADGSFTEQFWPFTFTLKLGADEDGIKWPVSGWKLGKIPLPKFLTPRSESHEFQDELGRFRFDVRLILPVVGLLAHYQGWLEPGAGQCQKKMA